MRRLCPSAANVLGCAHWSSWRGTIAYPVVAFDDETAHAALPELDSRGQTDRTGADDQDVGFCIGYSGHSLLAQSLWRRQADVGRYWIW